MPKTKLLVCSHNHVPFGSSDGDFERAYRNKHKPFLISLYRYPTIQAVLHYSGVLLEWLEKHHPEFLMSLADLINRKQVELLGGGFYDPMMPLIPLTDKVGQIELETTIIRKRFGKRPRGCWLPGLIWEQNLPGTLQPSGMDYVFLSAEQFRAAGLSGVQVERPCFTEDQGRAITVFPISDHVDLPLCLADTSSFVDSIARPAPDGGERFIAFFPERYLIRSTDDGAAEAQLSLFFDTISHCESQIELTTPLKALKNFSVTEKAYFQSSAERRVMYWAMDERRRHGFDELFSLERKGALKTASSYFTGAFPRQFLIRYPEANGIYSKMIYTHVLINQLRGDKYRKKTAREELWKAQGCDGFWHVEEGGIYRNPLRKAIYRALIGAEKITREKGVFLPSIVSLDFDMDGKPEYLFQGTDLNCYVRRTGGAIFELDHLGKCWNYLDTFARRKEAYLNSDCIQDRHRRYAFVDNLLPQGLSLKEFSSGDMGKARSCADEDYLETEIDRAHHILVLRKEAVASGNYASIEILKRYQLKKSTLSVSYTLTNRGAREESCTFVPEIDLSFASAECQSLVAVRGEQSQKSTFAQTEFQSLDEFRIVDGENDITVSLSSASALFDLWLLPIFTRCRIEDSLVDQYQSTCLMPIIPVKLLPGEAFSTSFTLRFTR